MGKYQSRRAHELQKMKESQGRLIIKINSVLHRIQHEHAAEVKRIQSSVSEHCKRLAKAVDGIIGEERGPNGRKPLYISKEWSSQKKKSLANDKYEVLDAKDFLRSVLDEEDKVSRAATRPTRPQSAARGNVSVQKMIASRPQSAVSVPSVGGRASRLRDLMRINSASDAHGEEQGQTTEESADLISRDSSFPVFCDWCGKSRPHSTIFKIITENPEHSAVSMNFKRPIAECCSKECLSDWNNTFSPPYLRKKRQGTMLANPQYNSSDPDYNLYFIISCFIIVSMCSFFLNIFCKISVYLFCAFVHKPNQVS